MLKSTQTLLIIASTLFFFLTSAEPSRSSTKELESAIFQTIPWEESSPSLEQRGEMAKAMLAYWESFSSRVPRPSPSEVEWVTSELKTGGERFTRVINSPEFALYELSRHVDMCIQFLTQIIEAQSQEAKRQVEMFYWVKLVNCYSNSDIPLYLRNAGLSDGTYDGAFAMGGASLLLGRIVNVLVPTAMAETMNWTIEN